MDPLKSASPSNQPADGSDDPKLKDAAASVDANTPDATAPLGDVATDATVDKPAETDDSLGLASEGPAADKPADTPAFPVTDTSTDVATSPDNATDAPAPADSNPPAPFTPSDMPSTAPVATPGKNKSLFMLGLVVAVVLIAAILVMVVL